MRSFSEREGFKPIRDAVQSESMDSALRNSLWNVLTIFYWDKMKGHAYLRDDGEVHELFLMLWLRHFKEPVDNIPGSWYEAREIIRKYFFGCNFNEVYDLIEFVANYYPDESGQVNTEFMDVCNQVLSREMSAYRFVGDRIARLTSEEEIAEVEQALNVEGPLEPARQHLKAALRHFADRQAPDYRNSIKESICAVEGACCIITGNPKAKLGQAIKRLKDSGIEVHGALEGALGSLYGYASDADGIRHAMSDQSNLDVEDAKFMLVSCSAFINYLVAKSTKAGIKF
ncbi:AbiJ-NTD4 domain-containing protein [Chloroflexota bacterium]